MFNYGLIRLILLWLMASPMAMALDVDTIPCGIKASEVRASAKSRQAYNETILYLSKQATDAELQRYWARCEKPFIDIIRSPDDDGRLYLHTATVAQRLGSPVFQEYLAGLRAINAREFLNRNPHGITLMERHLHLNEDRARALFIQCARLADEKDPMGVSRDRDCHALGVLWVYSGLTGRPSADGIDRVRPIVGVEFYTVIQQRPEAMDYILRRGTRDGGEQGRQAALGVIACARDFPEGATEASPECRKVMADYLRYIRLTPQETIRALRNLTQSMVYWRLPPDVRAKTPIDAVVDRSGVVQAFFGVKALPWTE